MRPSMFLAILMMAIAFIIGLYAVVHAPYWGLGGSFVAVFGLLLLGLIADDVLQIFWLARAADVLATTAMLVFATILAPAAWLFTFTVVDIAGFVLMLGLASAATLISIVLWGIGAYGLPETMFIFFLESRARDKW